MRRRPAAAVAFVASSASLALTAFALLSTTGARDAAAAEPSAWLSVGGGYALARNQITRYDDRAAVLTTLIGVGTSPDHAIVVGGVFRTVTYFTLGTDLSLGPRLATRGFARGDWGLALDVGVGARWWKRGDYGRYPVQAVLTGGAPWGVQLAAGVDTWNLAGDPVARSAFVALELDFLRLTVMRKGPTDTAWTGSAPSDAPASAPAR